jgi:hypothetical protein
MLAIELFENSPDTPQGSRTEDLNLGKLWLLTTLNRLGLDEFDNIYVLGSWYGSFGPYLLYKNIKFDTAYLVDIKPKNTEWTQQLNRQLGIEDKIIAVTQDCCDTEFVGDRILVINTSTNDISNTQWLDNIPPGSVVAIQGRDGQPDNPDNLHQTLESFDRAYPLAEELVLDTIELDGADGQTYKRFMKIGIR